jgi:hypothetical protein
MASSPGGMLRPNALAVLRLITKSNLVDCKIGRSAAFSPLPRPSLTGSPPLAKTVGIVVVAALAALPNGCHAQRSPSPDGASDRLRGRAVGRIDPAPSDTRTPLAIDVAGFTNALPECGQKTYTIGRRRAAEEPNHRHRSLLGARRERPRSCCAAEQGDELSAPHSITSSARASSIGGTSRPSDLAV